MILPEPARLAKHAGRPLIVRCGAFGDMVLLTALIGPLHARLGLPVDILTSGPWGRPLLEGQPGVGDVLTLRSRKMPYWLAPDQWQAVRGLRERAPGLTWLCDANDAVDPIVRRAGITAGQIVDVREHPRHAGEHTVEQWRRLALETPPAWAQSAPRGLADRVAGCRLTVSAARRAELEAWLEARGIGTAPLLLVQAGNKRTMRRGLRRLAVNHKYWPGERWAEVLRFLAERHAHHRIVLLGTGPEQRLNAELIGIAGVPGVVNAADDLPIPRLVALLERAAALVGVDSGPAHAAAAVGCPQVVLFGKALPSLYRPWGAAGAPVTVLTGVEHGAPSMLGIAAGQVIDALNRLPLRAAPVRSRPA